MRRIIYLFSYILVLNLSAFGQTDNEFWFAAPDISASHGSWNFWGGDGRPLYLHMSAVYATTVTIDRPADASFIPITFNLAQGESKSLHLDAMMPLDEIECYANGTVENKGFRITSEPGEITAFYEANNPNNKDIFALKGKNALGHEFTVSTQDWFPNNTSSPVDKFSGFVILATQNNTTVTIETNDSYKNHVVPGTFTINLNAGETYVFEATSTAEDHHVKGVKVTTNENTPIAITVYDDSMYRHGSSGGGCWDIFGDQYIPENLLGHEYLVMKGHLSSREEMIFITAITDNTDIDIDGVNVGTINTGEMFRYEITNKITHVYVSNPAYVNHTTGFGCEQGGAVLPTIDNCTGSYDVTFARSAPNHPFYLNIMIKNDTVAGEPAVDNFYLYVDGNKYHINPTFFAFTADGNWAYLKDAATPNTFFMDSIPSPASESDPPTVATIKNTVRRYHLGVINGDASTGCKYGYFSDYSANKVSAGIGGAQASQSKIYCSLDPIRIVASGGKDYEWNCISHPWFNSRISDRFVAAPYFYPDTTNNEVYNFEVNIAGECLDTTISLLVLVSLAPVPDFEVSVFEGCSPLTPTITNKTLMTKDDKAIWSFNPPGNVDEIHPNVFTKEFINDTTFLQIYTVSLHTYNKYNKCHNQLDKIIRVKPGVTALISVDDSAGCNEFPVSFKNNSIGHLDSTSFFWDFGDEHQSNEFEPDYLFGNYTDRDTTFNTKLIVTSPLGCKDTADIDINVYPKITAVFTVDTNYGCSPLTFNLNPSNSFGVDSLFWNFEGDSVHTRLDKSIVNFTHRDLTPASPDTIKVFLVTKNDFGCTDTTTTRKLVVYPEIVSVIDVDTNVVCDSVPLLFSNNSQGTISRSEWNFGDNTSKNDNTLKSYTKVYLNRTDSSRQFPVSLRVLSSFQCESFSDTVITVHPYINTDFGMAYEDNCSPIDVTLFDASTRVHNYDWDFGDGFVSSSSDPVLFHQFINTNISSDVNFTIKLRGSNNEGCLDSTQRNLIVFQPVVASFTPIDTAGCSPLVVSITNNSTGVNPTFNWDFGDSTFNSTDEPVFNKTYSNYTQNDITYTITLTAESSQGCDSTVTGTVTAFAEIESNFTMPVQDSCPPFKPRITNLSSPGVNYTGWYIDSVYAGSQDVPVIGSLNNASTEADTIEIMLVTYGQADPEHYSCKDVMTKQVIIYPEMDASFSLDKVEACQPFTSTIANNSNIISGSAFTWFLDNKQYSILAAPRDLNVPNETADTILHKLKLNAVTNHGCRDTDSVVFMVHSLVDARFTTTKRICSGDSIFIDRKASAGGITAYNWNFNNEEIISFFDTTFYHTFDNLDNPNPATKIVELTVVNAAGCDSTWSEDITIYPKVVADFNPDSYTICYPHTTQFFNETKNATTYIWDFDNGTSSTDSTPKHKFKNLSYTDDRSYDVQLIARSQYNCYDSITKEITIYAKPDADFSFPVSVDCPPFLARMVDSSKGSGLSYYWDFAGENSATTQNTSYTFENKSSSIQDRPVTLYVESDKGCKDTVTNKLRIYPEVTADFTSNALNGCSPLHIKFDGQMLNGHQLDWLLNDKTFSTVEDPEFTFNNDSPDNMEYKVTFIARSIYNCADTMEKTIEVYSTPIADFVLDSITVHYNKEEDLTSIIISNETVFPDNWSYKWDYGDGNVNNEASKEFSYNYGSYFWGDNSNFNKVPIELIAWNTENNGCRDTIIHSVRILPPDPELEILGDIGGCAPYTAVFKAYTKYIYEDEYYWDFGNGITSTNRSPSYIYGEPGIYTVKLIVRGDGGTKWDATQVNVYPKPNADFSFSDTLAFVSSQTKSDDVISFYNHTKHGSEYEWFFDKRSFYEQGLADSYEKEPKHVYSDTGTFYPVLIATSEHECSDTAIHTKAIRVKGEGMIVFPTGFFVDPTKGPSDTYNTDQYTPNMYLFYPKSYGVEKYKLEVYNRWGTLVFSSVDVNKGWDGYIDGIPGKQDVYIWRCHGEYTDGTEFELSGDVTLFIAPVNVDPSR